MIEASVWWVLVKADSKQNGTGDLLFNFYKSRFSAPHISRTVQLIKLKFFLDSYTIKFYIQKQYQLYWSIPWYDMDFTKAAQIIFSQFCRFISLNSKQIRIGNFIIDASQLGLFTVKILAFLSEVFGQGTLHKNSFFIKNLIFDVDFLDSSHLNFYRCYLVWKSPLRSTSWRKN